MLTFRFRGSLAKLLALSGLILLGILTFTSKETTLSTLTHSRSRSRKGLTESSTASGISRLFTKANVESSTLQVPINLNLRTSEGSRLQVHQDHQGHQGPMIYGQGRVLKAQGHLSKLLDAFKGTIKTYTGGLLNPAGGEEQGGASARSAGIRVGSEKGTLSPGASPGGSGKQRIQYIGTAATSTNPPRPGKHSRASSSVPPTLPRVLCWILTDPGDLEKRTRHVRDTWARRCDVTLYMSSERNASFPTVGLPVPAGRNHIAAKAKAAWTHVWRHHLDDADFFVKADPDTYIVVENLKEYLSHESPGAALYYGHRFHQTNWGYTYMSGGSGLVLTREAVRRLVNNAFSIKPSCMPDGQGEDWKTARCLSLVGGRAVDTRDDSGRERFMVFTPAFHIRGRYPQWYVKRDPDGALRGSKCCSDYPVSFHYIKPDQMYVLDYFLYHARPHGKEATSL